MIHLYEKSNDTEKLEYIAIGFVKMQEEFSNSSYEWRTKRLANKKVF
ncbi:hypothetical protein MKX79_11700 [Viridibacillus sp. FSL R5-0468]